MSGVEKMPEGGAGMSAATIGGSTGWGEGAACEGP